MYKQEHSFLNLTYVFFYYTYDDIHTISIHLTMIHNVIWDKFIGLIFAEYQVIVHSALSVQKYIKCISKIH